MSYCLPKIQISLSKIEYNTRQLCELYRKKGISVMGVSKAVLGDPFIAKAMIRGGVTFIADSRLENIYRMKYAGVLTQFVLLRTALSQAELVVSIVDISLNTEIETIRKIAYYAQIQKKIHRIILMIELGDLREGILPADLGDFMKEVLALPSVKVVGVGCNLACYGGIKPDNQKMSQLSELVEEIEKDFSVSLSIVSGGNSANYEWYQSSQDVGRINNLRLGESILLGCETVRGKNIPRLYANIFNLVAEVIESKEKPSLPYGEICRDAFGNIPVFLDQGWHHRAIVALGKQDVVISGLKSKNNLKILGSSSDHLVLDSGSYSLHVGSTVNFNLDYSGLSSAMSSPFIQKKYILDTSDKPFDVT